MIHILTDKKLKAIKEMARAEGFADATLKAYSLGFALGQVSKIHQGIILGSEVSQQLDEIIKNKDF